MNELINTELEEIKGQDREGFTVNDINQASWCLRKIRALKTKINETKELAAQERERINNWEKAESKGSEESIGYFENLLCDYFKRVRETDPKAKVSTPYGKISSRKSTKWNYTDEEGLLKYLKENNSDLIRTKEEINKAELKKKYKDGIDKETGEILPGVQVSTEESIQIKTE